MKKFLIILILILVAGSVGFFVYKNKEKTPEEPPAPLIYEVKFVNGQEILKSYELESGNLITEFPEENPTLVGHNFVEWQIDNESVDFSTFAISSDLIITAKFEAIEYTATFTADGETIDSVQAPYGSNLVNIEAPTKSGYNFIGWTSDNGATVVSDLTTITVSSDMTFEAVYEEITVIIEYYMTENERLSHSTYEYNQSVKFPAQVQKASHYGNNVYTVISWVHMTTGEEVSVGEFVNVTEAHAGKWRAKYCLTPTGTFVCQELVGNESIAASEITLNYDKETGILTSSQITEHLTLNLEFSHAMGIGDTRYTIDGIEHFENLTCDYNYDKVILYVFDGTTEVSYTFVRAAYPETGFYL